MSEPTTGRLFHVRLADAPALRVRPPALPARLDVAVEGLALVHWAVPPERLAPLLPAGLTPAVVEAGRKPVAWLTLALGRWTLRGVGGLPVVPVGAAVAAYRTYVAGPNGHRQVLLRAVVGPRPVPPLGELPIVPRSFRFQPRIAGGRLLALEAEVGHAGAELDLAIEAVDDAPWTPGFADPSAAVRALGDVPEILYERKPGSLALAYAHHAPLAPEAGRLARARLGWAVEHGLLLRSEVSYPASVFLQARAELPLHV